LTISSVKIGLNSRRRRGKSRNNSGKSSYCRFADFELVGQIWPL
jgi:hypothetical protein